MTIGRKEKIDRRQFVKQAGFMTGISLGTLGEPADSRSVAGRSLEERNISDQEKSRPVGRPKKQRRIILSEDGTWWLGGDGRLTRRHLERFVEGAAGVVDTLAAVMAMPDICFYDTKVGDLFGAGLTRFDSPSVAQRTGETSALIFWQQIHAIRSLIESGNDPAVVLPEECHKRGMEAVARIKMNDHHHVHPRYYPYRSSFLMKNPQWHIRENADVRAEIANDKSFEGIDLILLDYSFREVREHRFAIVRELVERYDWDGLELDFTRIPYLFPTHLAEERAPIMTEYIGRIRELLDKEGQKRGKGALVLGVRVPHTLQMCKENGMDIPSWIKKGLLDYVCPGGLLRGAELTMKVEEFKALTHGTSCRIYPSIQPYISSVPGGAQSQMTRGMYRAAAHNYYTWGADGINFYNLEGYNYLLPLSLEADVHDLTGEKSHRGMLDREMLREVASPKTVGVRDRHYVFFPHDSVVGAWQKLLTKSYLHTHIVSLDAADPGQRKVFPFRIAEDFKDARAKFTLRFKAVNKTFEDELEIDLNGSSLPMKMMKQTYHWRGVSEWGVLPPFYLYEAVLTSPPAKKGDNELGARLTKKNRELEQLEIYIQDVEVLVHYVQ